MKTIYLILTILCTYVFFSQEPYRENASADYINGIQLFNPATQDQSPFISMGDYFILSFDDLSSSYQRFKYYIKHYDRHWIESDLFESQYIQGYFTDNIQDYTASYNSLQNYVHYELQFPNERIRPKLSGNYAIFVYTHDKKKPLFSRRFAIYEDNVIMGIQQERISVDDNNNSRNQRVMIIAQSNEQYNLNNNIAYTSLTVVQNNNFHNAIYDIRPQFTFNNRLEFQQIELQFYGGNEFYWFDTKNIDVMALTTQEIVEEDLYSAFLYPNAIYPEFYDYNPDINGAYYFRRNDLGTERDVSIEGDYVWVNFALSTPKLPSQEIYVVGAFNEFALNNFNRMEYNEELGLYEKSILLKQGYYNYQYIGVNHSNNQFDYTLDGNFWETQNLYTALLYTTDFNLSYDRLIGFGEIE